MSNDKLAQALRDIIDPFDYLERNLPEGYRLDGQAALQQINSREFYARIAREALAAAPNVQPKGAANPVVWTDAAILSLMNRVGDGPFGEEDVAVTRRFMGHVEEIRSELFAAQAPAPGTEAHTLIKQCRDALASAPAVNPATTRVCGHFAPASAPASAEGDDLPPLPAATWPRNVGTPSWTAEEVQAYARSALARVQPKGADAEQEWNYVIECRDGFVPNVKGPFNKQFTESTLREFAAMRPSYLMVVRSTGWPSIESGVEWIDAFGDKRRGRLAVQSPAPAQPMAASGETIAKCQGVMDLIDAYVDRPNAGNRLSIRNALLELAAPAPAVAHGWQPIDTAPKAALFHDGSHHYAERVLVWWPGADIEPVRARWWFTDGGVSNFIADGGYAVFPTVWTRLPKPPVQGSQS